MRWSWWSVALGCAAGAAACGDAGSGTGGETETGGGIAVGCTPNGVRDAEETDIDCGGPDCPRCDAGASCLLDGDCAAGSCANGTCVVPSCTDGVQNQNEVGIDCGGICSNGCAPGSACNIPSDCASGLCEGSICTALPCADGVMGGEETDIDCGGSMCDRCDNGQTCATHDDCASRFCNADGICQARSCQDDGDCGFLASDCGAGVCNLQTYACEVMPINEDLDCDDGDPCTLGTTCSDAVCGGGAAPDCTGLDGPCTQGTCDPTDGSCVASPINEDAACDDGDPCTAGDRCIAGACTDADGPDVHLDEDFSDNGAGWTLGPDWAIGPATASAVGEVGGADPDDDNTATADDGIAGMVIGGLVTGGGGGRFIESPVLDLSAAPGPLQLRMFHWLNCDANGEMVETIEVFDGASWVVLFENTDAVTSSSWSESVFDITAHKNANFRLRVGHDPSGNPADVAGWNLDDIRIAPPTCPP